MAAVAAEPIAAGAPVTTTTATITTGEEAAQVEPEKECTVGMDSATRECSAVQEEASRPDWEEAGITHTTFPGETGAVARLSPTHSLSGLLQCMDSVSNSHPSPLPVPVGDTVEDTLAQASGTNIADCGETLLGARELESQPSLPESLAQLIPGSEVQVSLDHVIGDALVVSFSLGEKVFSGVLMDISKRFGPYGIPVTIFPKREYRDKSESMQLKTEPFQSEIATEEHQEMSVSPEESSRSSTFWTSKPPPLFQEGIAYPPPLFIRDTYNQSIPQPPPRKIKRPKRRLYREEPTSIMSAIKLRPRQVLCDKCKSSVVGDNRVIRRGPVSDCRGDDGKRRRVERGRGVEGPKRQAPAVSQVKGGGGNKVANSSRIHLNNKKVLQSKNVDHSKASEVLKMAKAQNCQRRSLSGSNAKTTRASSLQDAHQKVHFTRRLHQSSGGNSRGTSPLPPRIRIKPQRYRNEENDSSTCKNTGTEKVPGSSSVAQLMPSLPRCSSTGSSSSSCSVDGVATVVENQGVTRAFEPKLRRLTISCTQVGDLQIVPVNGHRESGADPENEGRKKRQCKFGHLSVLMSLDPSLNDSSNASLCSVESSDELKSSHSECSSTETLLPPGTSLLPTVSNAQPLPFPAKRKRGRPMKAQVFSDSVSKCVTPEGTSVCIGDIVWAKISGFPWWPARVLTITVSHKDNGHMVRQEASVSWFGSPTTSFLALSQLSPFLENFKLRFDKKRKGMYRKAISEAAKAARQLSPEVCTMLEQFET